MGALFGWGKAYLKSKAKGITSVKPGTNLGGKTAEQWKKVITNKKSEAIGKKYRDELKAVGAKLTSKVNQKHQSILRKQPTKEELLKDILKLRKVYIRKKKQYKKQNITTLRKIFNAI